MLRREQTVGVMDGRQLISTGVGQGLRLVLWKILTKGGNINTPPCRSRNQGFPSMDTPAEQRKEQVCWGMLDVWLQKGLGIVFLGAGLWCSVCVHSVCTWLGLMGQPMMSMHKKPVTLLWRVPEEPQMKCSFPIPPLGPELAGQILKSPEFTSGCIYSPALTQSIVLCGFFGGGPQLLGWQVLSLGLAGDGGEGCGWLGATEAPVTLLAALG